MSTEELADVYRRLLRLEPWDAFAERQRTRVGQGERQTGRTTRRVLDAFACAVVEGKPTIIVRGWSHDHTNLLVRNAERTAAKLTLALRVVPGSRSDRYPNHVIFEDHDKGA